MKLSRFSRWRRNPVVIYALSVGFFLVGVFVVSTVQHRLIMSLDFEFRNAVLPVVFAILCGILFARLNLMRAQASFLAAHDHLTGLYRRQYFEQLLEEHIRYEIRWEHGLSLMLFDIDFFKRINDTRGHKIGDEVLMEVAALVRAMVRDSDLCVRWGGEEFVVLLPHTQLEGAYGLAERMRGQIALHHFACGHLTCSFGVVQYQAGDTPDTFVDRADKAMYLAKDGGRDKVVRG